MSLVLSWLANLLGGPFISAALAAYKSKLDAGNDQARISADLAARELSLQAKEMEIQAQVRIAEIGRWYEPDKIMAYAVAIYFAKLLIWDKVLALGSTDPLAGWAATTANLIVAFYFGKRGFENITKILAKRS
jgi:hypothetical protein